MNYRQIGTLLFVLGAMSMAYALVFLQGHLELMPCPLCIFQRIGVLVMMIFALPMMFNPKNIAVRFVLWFGAFLGVLWSFGVAARHVWLQYMPSGATCGAGLDYWLDTMPLDKVLAKVFHGSGSCADIDWTLLGLSIPAQALIAFGLMLMFLVYQLFTIKPRTPIKTKKTKARTTKKPSNKGK